MILTLRNDDLIISYTEMHKKHQPDDSCFAHLPQVYICECSNLESNHRNNNQNERWARIFVCFDMFILN